MYLSRSRLGAWLWVLGALVFFAANIAVGLRWNTSYSWLHNNVSDLGVTTCGNFTDNKTTRYACSPWHPLMNASFAVAGALVLAGVVLTWNRWLPGRAKTSRVLIGIGAFAWILVGLFPADVHRGGHGAAAWLIFYPGNIGLLSLGWSKNPQDLWVRIFTIGAGFIAVFGTFFFVPRIYLGIGTGGMERLAVFPLFMWALVMGIALLRSMWPRFPTNR